MLESKRGAPLRVALAGCPNSGKSSLFNLLSGGRQRVANYPGVTVQCQSGFMRLGEAEPQLELLDLPGCYSLSSTTAEQRLATALLRAEVPGEAPIDLVLCVIDACQFEQQLPLLLDLKRQGLPLLAVLNQSDVARRLGVDLDAERLAELLGVPVVFSVAVRKSGVAELRAALRRATRQEQPIASDYPTEESDLAGDGASLPVPSAQEVITAVLRDSGAAEDIWTQRLDRYLLHPLLGPVALGLTLLLVFQAVFSWSGPPSDFLAGVVESLTLLVAGWLPVGLPGRGLLLEGIMPGLGVVVEFLPPILILNLLLLLLDGSGYISRIAFFVDEVMASMGLSGHAVFPFLAGFACAIPALMSVRSIPSERVRHASILALPLVPCSARLPVYTLVIAAVIPARELAWGIELQGLVMFGLYLVGFASSMAVAAVIGYLDRGRGVALRAPIELPSFRWPVPRNVLLGLWVRTAHFLRRAGTVIVATVVVLWFMTQVSVTGPGIDGSLLGVIGSALHPLFAPLGFNWEMTVALLPGMVAREVAVSSLATIYAVQGGEEGVRLATLLSDQWSLATGVSFAVWYIYAPQCMATLGTVRAETGSWKYVAIAFGYLFALAWLASFISYRLFSA